MTVRRFALLPLVALLACGGSKKPAEDPSSAAAASGPSREGPAEVGKPAPDLSIQTLNGAKSGMKLDALSGKVVIVDFWATWCGPCRQSFPSLQALAKRYEGQLTVVGVSVNDEEDGIADFAKELGTTFPVGWDKGHAIADRWKVATMPSSYIVDGTGTVRFVHAGFHEGEEVEIEKEVASLLGKAPPPADPKPEAKTDTPPAGDTAAPPPAEGDAADKPAKKTTKKTNKKTQKKKPKKKQPPADGT